MSKQLIAAALAAALFTFTPFASAHPGYAGFGNGAHDLAPHWHTTQTPFGSYAWYGNGVHDLLPHHHTVSPWGGVRSYSNTPFSSTTSYNGYPGYGGYGGYAPYGGYGGYAASEEPGGAGRVDPPGPFAFESGCIVSPVPRIRWKGGGREPGRSRCPPPTGADETL